MDLTETGQEYVFEVDLPGLKPQQFQMCIDEDRLFISGQRVPRPPGGKRLRVERPSGAFVLLALPKDAQGEVQATFSDGVLELRVPKACLDAEFGQTHTAAHDLEVVMDISGQLKVVN